MIAYKTLVTFPYSGLTYTFKSERAVARMLSGTGRASGGLRRQIGRAADQGGVAVRRNHLETLRDQLVLDLGRAA